MFGSRGESLTSQRIIKDKQINHDNHHDESKTRTRRFNKLPYDGDPWAPNNLSKSGVKEKHQLDPFWPSNRQEAPVPTNFSEEVQVGKDQEKAQSEKDSHSKNRGGKKPN